MKRVTRGDRTKEEKKEKKKEEKEKKEARKFLRADGRAGIRANQRYYNNGPKKSQETYRIIIKVAFIKVNGYPFIKMVKRKTYSEANWLNVVFMFIL